MDFGVEFRGRTQLFCMDDAIFMWPLIFGIGRVKIEKFDPGPENCRFALVPWPSIPNFERLFWGFILLYLSPIMLEIEDKNAPKSFSKFKPQLWNYGQSWHY